MMSCTVDCIRWLLYVFNFIFALCGLGIIIPAVYFYQNIKEVPEKLQSETSALLIGAIVVGIIVFVIAFFGCCGALKGNHCMAIIFAGLLVTILVIQVSIAIAAFVKTHGFKRTTFDEIYQKEFDEYWTSDISRGIVDFTQIAFSCCGVDSPDDYLPLHPGMNGTFPMSCCTIMSDSSLTACSSRKVHPEGCSVLLFDFFKSAGKILGSIALGVAGVEIIGIIFAVYLANSLRNSHRRAFA